MPRHTKRLRDLVLVVLLVLPSVALASDFKGVILDDKGKAVSGAIVTVARSSVDGPLPATESYTITTATDGTYSIPGLTAGPFVVCAVAPGRPLLDPCQWSPSQNIVRLTAGTAAAAASTQLQLGATVSIRMNDPALLLTTPVAAGNPQPFLAMGVFDSGGHFHQAWRTSSDSGGYNYALVVPTSVNLAFVVSATNLTVKDSTNTLVPPSQQLNVNLAAGGTLQLQYGASAVAAAQ